MANREVYKIFCILILLFSTHYVLIEKQSYAEGLMFSSRYKTNKNLLFVVNNNEVFTRRVHNGRFFYESVKNGSYEMENGSILFVEGGIIQKTEGVKYTSNNDDKISRKRFTDEFFLEKNLECNTMKFELINKLFVLKENISAFETQLYLPEYFSVLRLILFKDSNDSGKLKAFVVSDKNEIGCAFFEDYKIYKNEEIVEGTKKRNKKKKKIIAKTEQEFLQKLATESYKPILLDGYTYLQPIKYQNDINDVVLRLQNSNVKYIDNVALGVVWSDLGYDEIFTEIKIKAKNNNKIKKKQYKQGEVINDKEAVQYM